MQLVLQGKRYAKVTRAHKLTYQALRQILMPTLRDWLGSRQPLLVKEIDNAIGDRLKYLHLTTSNVNLIISQSHSHTMMSISHSGQST